MTSLLPHANAGELFVWAGIAEGVRKADPALYPRLAILYFLTGIVVILIRGLSTQWTTKLLISRGGHKEVFDRFDALYAEGHMQGAKSEGGVL